jgi:hypothetical protein
MQCTECGHHPLFLPLPGLAPDIPAFPTVEFAFARLSWRGRDLCGSLILHAPPWLDASRSLKYVSNVRSRKWEHTDETYLWENDSADKILLNNQLKC